MTAQAESKPYERAKARYLEHLETRRRFHAGWAERISSAMERISQSEWSDPRQIFAIVPRKRDREFAQRVIVNMSKGLEPERAAIEAVKDTWRFTTDQASLAVAKQKLGQPEVCLAMELAYEAAAGFRFDEAIKLHVDHIKGNLTKQTVVDGEIVEMKIPPSLPALVKYLDGVTPKQTTKVITGHFDLNAALKAKPEEQEPRFVGPVIESKGSEEEDYTEETLRDLAEEEDDG